jgi:hypothetical protein
VVNFGSEFFDVLKVYFSVMKDMLSCLELNFPYYSREEAMSSMPIQITKTRDIINCMSNGVK